MVVQIVYAFQSIVKKVMKGRIKNHRELVKRGIKNNGISEFVSSILTTKIHSITALEVEYVVCVR